jgi:hypothetical protein
MAKSKYSSARELGLPYNWNSTTVIRILDAAGVVPHSQTHVGERVYRKWSTKAGQEALQIRHAELYPDEYELVSAEEVQVVTTGQIAPEAAKNHEECAAPREDPERHLTRLESMMVELLGNQNKILEALETVNTTMNELVDIITEPQEQDSPS